MQLTASPVEHVMCIPFELASSSSMVSESWIELTRLVFSDLANSLSSARGSCSKSQKLNLFGTNVKLSCASQMKMREKLDVI
jgi:hypothetical protein